MLAGQKRVKSRALLLGMLSFVLSFFFVDSFFQASAEKANSEPSFSIEKVREEAFWELEHWMDVSMFSKKDDNRKAHKKAIKKGRHRLVDEKITSFKNGSYRVEMPSFGHGLYYRNDGTLSAVEFYLKNDYPYKTHKYSYPFGRLLKTSINLSASEAFSFSASGNLEVRWKNGFCYKKDGRPCDSRRAFSR